MYFFTFVKKIVYYFKERVIMPIKHEEGVIAITHQ
jgi:hypothetical protein